jgi:hypothetical protein
MIMRKRKMTEFKWPPKPKAREFYPEKEVFDRAKECIHNTFGLELTIIEQAELKQYISPALDGLDAIKTEGGARESYDPIGEVVTRFMCEYYELPFEVANMHTTPYPEIYIKNKKEVMEYFKIIQDRKHLI